MIKNFIAFLILTTSLFIYGCFDLPNEVIVPEWDVDLNLPVINKYYSLEDIIQSEKDPYISIDPADGLYLLETEKYVLSSDVSDFLFIENESANENIPIYVLSGEELNLFFQFANEIEIHSGSFSTGLFTFRLANYSTTETITVNFRIPGFRDLNGNEVSIDDQIAPLETKNIYYNLKDNIYREPSDQDENFKGKIWIIASGYTTTGSPAAGLLDMYTTNISFHEAYGYFPRKSLGTRSVTHQINLGSDILDFRDKAVFKEAKLVLDAQYISSEESIFEIEVRELRIEGKRKDGIIKQLEHSDWGITTYRTNSGSFNALFDENNSNIDEFISFLPDTVTLTAEYIMNPSDDKTYRYVNHSDSIIFESKFETKSHLSLRNSTVVDTSLFELSANDRAQILKGNTADLTIEVENAIPLTAFFNIKFLDENFNDLFSISDTQPGDDSLRFAGAEINSLTGASSNPVSGSSFIALSREQLELLTKAVYLISSTTVRTKNAADEISVPPFVSLRPNDWIKIRAYGKFSYRIK
jgi:hypothetical protein